MEKLRIALYTAIYGNYDRCQSWVTQQPSPLFDLDYILFTDDAQNQKENCSTIVYDPLPDVASPVLKSKYLRVFPFKVPALNNYDLCIYLDGNIAIRSDILIADLLTVHCVQDFPFTLSTHPSQTCIYKEAEFCLSIPKYRNTDLTAQTIRYHQEGYPDGAGLYWSGFLIHNRMTNSEEDRQNYERLCRVWWEEINKYCKDPLAPFFPQCQVSLPYALHKSGLRFSTLPPMYGNTKHFSLHWHK